MERMGAHFPTSSERLQEGSYKGNLSLQGWTPAELRNVVGWPPKHRAGSTRVGTQKHLSWGGPELGL